MDLTCIPGQTGNPQKCCHCKQISSLFTFRKMICWITYNCSYSAGHRRNWKWC